MRHIHKILQITSSHTGKKKEKKRKLLWNVSKEVGSKEGVTSYMAH